MEIFFIPAAFYICASLILPLRMPLYWRVVLVVLFLIGGFRHLLLNIFWAGEADILPEAPRMVMIITSTLYSAVLIFAQLTAVRDVLLWTWSALRRRLPKRTAFNTTGIIVGLVGVVLTAICMYESMRIPRVKEVEHHLAIPAQYDGLKVVLIPDIHLSPINDANYAKGIVEKVNALQPDLILLVGDTVDGSVEKRKEDIAPLAELKAKYGVFATMGNHESYSGYRLWLEEYRRLGIAVLENENVEIFPGLSLVGVGDWSTRFSSHPETIGAPSIDYQKSVENLSAENAIILLAHDPIESNHIPPIGKSSLHVAGHTHGGMMWGALYAFVYHLYDGCIEGWCNGNERNGYRPMYVSRGAGTWPGAMFRLGVPSEITLLRIRSHAD